MEGVEKQEGENARGGREGRRGEGTKRMLEKGI